MKRVDLIINPAAGKGESEKFLPDITHKLNQYVDQVREYHTKKPGDGAIRINQIAGKTDLVIAVGGDGTVHELANALCSLEVRPRFAILPAGTCNDFSRAIGMNQNPDKALEQILQQREQKVDVGYSSQGRYFLNFWGIGLITEISSEIDPDDKERIGRLAYYISAAQKWWNPTPFHLKLKSSSRQYEGEAAMLIVGNGSYIGGVQGFFPHSELDDGQLDVLALKENSLGGVASMLFSHITQEWPKNEDVLYFQADHLTVSTSPHQKIDCDGEKGEYTPVRLSSLPGHLTLLTGDREKT